MRGLGKGKRHVMGAVFLALLAVTASAWAFKLKPEETAMEKKLRELDLKGWVGLDRTAAAVMSHFSSPVHEQITNEMFGCKHHVSCGEAKKYAPKAVIAGVRWNDNPPFSINDATRAKFSACKGHDFDSLKLPNYSDCWVSIFKAAEKGAFNGAHYRAQVTGDQYLLLNRVHFGDMQFLHSMGSWEGEPASTTKASIMMWAEYTYRLALGELPVDAEMRNSGVKRMSVVFRNLNWSAERLFTLGDTTFRNDAGIRNMALGSLLHMVQDGFSKPHVKRDAPTGGKCAGFESEKAPGAIEWFHSYNKQDSGKHGGSDTWEAYEAHFEGQTPNVVTVGQVILREFRAGTKWQKIAPYFECIYTLSDEDAPAQSGVYGRT